MADEKDLDIKRMIEQGTKRMTLRDLAEKGFENVKVLDERQVQQMVTQAVERVVTTQTAEEKAKVAAESRKELDRLIREHRAIRSRAELLEADKHELVEQVENLQRQLQLKSDLEEETLHKKLEGGMASLHAQVEELRTRTQEALREREDIRTRLADLQGTHDAALAELEDLHKDAERLRGDRDRVEKEGEGTLAKLASLEKALAQEQAKARGAEKARSELVSQVLGLQSEVEALRESLQRAEEKARRSDQAGSDLLDRLKVETSRLGQAADAARAELSQLGRKLEEAERERDRALQEASMHQERAADAELRGRGARQDLEKVRAERARLEEELEKLRGSSAAADQDLAALRGDLEKHRGAEEALRREVAGAAERESAKDRELGGLRGENAALRGELAEARHGLEAEGKLRGEVRAGAAREAAKDVEIAGLRGEVERLGRDVEEAREETAFAKGQLAQAQVESDSHREKTVFVTAELAEIEEQQKAEQSELEKLRGEAARLGEEESRLRQDLESARGEAQALQELLAREQEGARTAQNESAALQSRLLDLHARAQGGERELDALRRELAGAEERKGLDVRVAKLETLLESARKSSAAARASAVRSQEVTGELERTLARQLRPKPKKRGPSLAGGAAYDGMAVLDGFFRKVRLKEHFQKHVPVAERPGEPHPSEMMVEVLKAILAGERKAEPGGKMKPLEVVGPPGAPGPEALRGFLGRLSSQAVRDLARVHEALRLHLSALPRKPEPLVLDVESMEIGVGRKAASRRTYRPLVAWRPDAEEFWSGQFRSGRTPDAEGIQPFLTALMSRIPAPFARGRIRLRLGPAFFNEAIVRYLESKGCGYVMPAPDSRAVRKAAREGSFSRLSNGWEVAEFSQRLHPIRKTAGRFIVVRRRHSKAAQEAGPGAFKDERHVYHVFAADRRATPWRTFEFWRERGAALERARGRLDEFTTSALRGRSRRSLAALFQAHLLASDLAEWFRRGCLPPEEKTHELAELRQDFLMMPAGAERSVLVLPRRDRRRRLFSRVARLTRRLRPARPFKFRK